MRRVLVALALLSALIACPRPQPDVKLPPTVGSVPIEDRRKDKLAGQALEERQEGPWTVRRTASVSSGEGAPAEAMTGAAPPVEAIEEDSFGVGGLGASGRGAGGGGAMKREPSMRPSPRMEMAAPEAIPSAPPLPGGGPGGRIAPPVQSAPLKAGSTDDNEDLDAFVKFLAQWSDRPETASLYQHLDVSDRRYVEVTDAAGRPVPGAAVDVYDARTERPLLTGTTYGDGRVPFYPKVGDPKGEAPAWLVNVRLEGRNRSASWDKAGEVFRVALDDERSEGEVPLDVLFLIDTTGSMSDEIQRIKETLLSVTKQLRESGKQLDLRYAAVLYKDVGDEYVTSTHPFTSDIGAFDQALQSVTAGGGGDTPESLNQGLAEAVHGVDWRERAAKVAFLIADAEPHMDYEDDVPYGESLKDAVARGIRVHAVAASGLGPFGTLCFRQVAQYTRGKFIFIEYGSAAKSAASHGVSGEVKSNNLDDIVLEQIRWEIEHYGR